MRFFAAFGMTAPEASLVQVDVADGWGDGFVSAFLKRLLKFPFEHRSLDLFVLRAPLKEGLAPFRLLLKQRGGASKVRYLGVLDGRLVGDHLAEGFIDLERRAAARAKYI